MSTNPPPLDVEAIVHGIRDASYLCLVSLTLIVSGTLVNSYLLNIHTISQIYDHILTFNVELESFWTLSLTWLRALFFVVSPPVAI